MDIFEKIKKNRGAIGQYQDFGHGYFAFPKLEGEIEPRMKFRGKEVLTWSLNNYLGLANHPRSGKLMLKLPNNMVWHIRWAPG